MKLRQKLAAVMATAMLVTSVPVVTMATTTNSVSMGGVSIVKDGEIGFTLTTNTINGTTCSVYNAINSNLTIDIESKGDYTLPTAGQTFFVEINNAKFSDAAFYSAAEARAINVDATGNVRNEDGSVAGVLKDLVKGKEITKAVAGTTYAYTIKKTSDTELAVTVIGTVEKGDVLSIPVFAVAKDGEVTVKVDGTDTFVTSETKVIGTTNSKAITAVVSDKKVLSEDGGTIGNIVIEENKIGALSTLTDRQIKIELDSTTDVEFATSNITLVGKKGLSEISTTPQSVEVDGDVMTITLPTSIPAGTARGQLSIEGIRIRPTNKVASTGEIAVTVKNKEMDSTKLVVANIEEHAVTLTCKEPVDVIAGKDSKTVEFTVKENIHDSIINDRKVDFTIENGYIAVRTKQDGVYASALDTFKAMIGSGDIVLPAEVKATDILAVEANAEGQITGFTVEFNNLKANTASELKFKMPVRADLTTTGEVKLAVEGRAIEEKLEAVIAKVTAPFEVVSEKVSLKVGLNGQVGGKLTIKETAAEMLEKGNVTITMPEGTGITFKKDQALKVTAENLKIKDVKVYSDEITFNVDRTSDEAGSIVVENIEFNVDRTAPEGSFDFEVKGTAISENVYMKEGLEALVVEDFLTISTANTEDLGSNGIARGTSSFKVDSTTYTVNGVEKVMIDGSKPYLQNGRVMVPLRYVSEAFGIDGANVMFDKGVITVIAGNRIVQLKNGTNVATLNGVSFTMDEAVVIKNGRSYIPLGEVGRLLGVNVSWNNESKVATFSN